MELRDIEYFAVVAEQRHIGRAAEVLGLTQPALSKSLRRLEQALGAKLVKRTPKGVELTPEGAALQSHVRRLRLSLADVGREITDLSKGRSGQLRIGVGPGHIEDLLRPACSALVEPPSRISLRVVVAANDTLLPALRKGELDLIISGIPTPKLQGLAQEPLIDDVVVVFASTSHRLAKLRRVTIADLARERWALTVVDAEAWALPQKNSALETSGLREPDAAIRTSYLPLRDEMVASSNLLGLSSRRYLRRIAQRLNVAELPVRELTWRRRVGVSYREDAYLSPAARRLIDLLKAAAQKVGSE
jgi:DNA-binding transcriptional LysR family regulator